MYLFIFLCGLTVGILSVGSTRQDKEISEWAKRNGITYQQGLEVIKARAIKSQSCQYSETPKGPTGMTLQFMTGHTTYKVKCADGGDHSSCKLESVEREQEK